MKQTFFDRLAQLFFSMKLMTLAMIIFLVGIGAATFIESIYGIQSAKIIIYNATWFEVLLLYLSMNLISNIFKYQMFQREKIAMLTFHLAFLIIMLGAAVTRYVSFEGLMVIKEGTSENFIFTADPHLLVHVENPINGKKTTEGYKHYLSEITDNSFEHEIGFENKSITISQVDFQSKRVDSLVIRSSFNSSVLDIVTDGMKSNYVGPNEIFMVGGIPLSFEKKLEVPGIEVRTKGDSVEIKTNVPIRYLAMSEMQKARQSGISPSDSLFTEIPLNKWVTFKTTTLYQSGNQQFVFKRLIKHSKKMLMPSGKKNVGMDYLTVKISDGKSSKNVTLEGGMGQIPTPTRFEFNGLIYQMEYGSIRKPIPFNVFCRDFKLDKYPGSESPSSFESELTIEDPKNNYKRNQKVFMNNVMDYDGYRFFQSSYDLDNPATPQNEEGTRLSVNHDWWGTNITYVGYLLMSIAMILSLLAPVGRFRDLNEKIKKLNERKKGINMASIILLLFVSFSNQTFAVEHKNHNHQTHKAIYRVISKDHSDELASLLVQDFKGRIIPIHTMCDELLRKFYQSNKYKDYNAVQTIMSMHMYPQYWMDQKIVKISSNLRDRLKLGEYASAKQLADATGAFKWLNEYKAAHQKPESKRDEFDKKLIKLNERFEVVQGIFAWQYMRLIPKKGDKNNTWYVPMNMELMQVDTISSITTLKYLSAIDEGAKNNSFGKASDLLKQIKSFQREIGKNVVPSETKVNVEISYNKMTIFKNSFRGYITLGLGLLILFFIQIFRTKNPEPGKVMNVIRKSFLFLLIVFFVYHGVGLGFRSYISGHAPWSNGYEALIYIAWMTMLAGLSFLKKNEVVVAGAAILASLMIMVSEMNLLDPEITPLVPVLKSYWLMIHVAIITGSYAFLGLGCIFGLLNLTLYIFRNKKNGEIVTLNISELTYISEMAITIGLFMLTIGTFLGGVWANESWGRYWGWDPKETWALVSVLVYAVILHLRMIPGLKGKFLFNVVSFWGYSAILFTFFGVNFMLVGLHSYAQGDGIGKFPTWLTWLIVFFVLFTTIAALRNKSYNKSVPA
jgi:cytochrome c-type biogenesis protein CcsB